MPPCARARRCCSTRCSGPWSRAARPSSARCGPRRQREHPRVHPLGVATKANGRYLLAGTERGLRTFRIDRMASFTAVDEPVERPDGFDLADAWQSVLARVDEIRAPVRVRATADPEALPYLRYVLADRVLVGQAGPDGRVEVEVRGHNERALAAELAGFGASLEVLYEPEGLRAILGRLGRELAERYR
ncbi:MAG: WYL domain-containing protein [Acidimicrobiales bacterium]